MTNSERDLEELKDLQPKATARRAARKKPRRTATQAAEQQARRGRIPARARSL